MSLPSWDPSSIKIIKIIFNDYIGIKADILFGFKILPLI